MYIYILCYVSTYFYDILNRARLNFYTGMLNYKVERLQLQKLYYTVSGE